MYARYAIRKSSPDGWSSSFLRRSGMQEDLSLLKLRTRRDPRWRSLEPLVGRGARVLDVGCGLGSWGLFLASRGIEVVGVDYSFPLLHRASQREASESVKWASAVAQHLPFRGQLFDCIVSWGVIEHDPAGPFQALSEFHRVLKVGGRVVVTVPLDGERQRRAEEIVNAGRARDEFYEYYFTPEELKNELENAGFKVEHCRPVTRSLHVAFPEVYRWLSRRGALARDLGTQVMKPLTRLRGNGFHMLLGIGTRT